MRYPQTAYHREFHRLWHLREGHHIGDWSPLPPISTSLVFGTLLQCCLSICPFKDDAATITLHSAQLTLGRFLSLDIDPYPVAWHLYASFLHPPPDVVESAYQQHCLLHIGLMTHLIENLHRHHQSVLNPYAIPSCYPPVHIPFSCCPAHTMMCLLWYKNYC